MKIIVQDNQTIYDIALQYAGSLEAVIDILEANGKADTTLLIGEELEVPNVITAKVANFFSDKDIFIATSSTPMDMDEWVAPEGLDRKVNISVNGDLLEVIKAPSSVNIEVVDSNDIVVDVDLVGGKVVVNDLPCAPDPIGGSAMALQTGQTTSYVDDDDGDTQRGRPFFTLPIVGGVQQLNHFGKKWRFTGVTGGYYDRDTSTYRLMDGTATTRALAYPNDFRCDWSTLDWNNDFILWDMYLLFYGTWQNCLNQIKLHTKSGYSGWYMPNDNEVISIRNTHNGGTIFQPQELADYEGDVDFWSSSTDINTTTLAWSVTSSGEICGLTKTDSNGSLAIRITNINEL